MRGVAESLVKPGLFEGWQKWRREDIASWKGRITVYAVGEAWMHHCYFCAALACFASNSPTGFVYSIAFEIKTMNVRVGNGSNTQYGMYPELSIQVLRLTKE